MYKKFDAVYFEPAVTSYPLGKKLLDKYALLPQIPIESHNRIPELIASDNKDFPKLKKHLILGTRKTHKYTENHKVSDWLVPFTSSGCSAMCLYCYLVCNYNKCSYLRIFVNREEMLERLIKKSLAAPNPQVFEIGSNSDLILENEITGNLVTVIEEFALNGRGKLTFPTKFDNVKPLLNLEHKGRVIFRISVNPDEIIRTTELGTSPLAARIKAANAMADAGYPVGIIIAPVILLPEWKKLYSHLITELSDCLSEKIRSTGFIEVILMTYSFVHDAINTAAFKNLPPIFDRRLMTGRGRGKYSYKQELRSEAEDFLKEEIKNRLKMPIIYFS